MGRLMLLIALLAPAAGAAVIDRTAVAVGTDVITETEILEEIRVVAFLNNQTPDFSPAGRRAAAERMVDQYLIRREMLISLYEPPGPSEAQAMLGKLKQARFRTDAEYRAALQQYGITEQQLLKHLLWQLTAMRFTDLRFRAGLAEPVEDILKRLEAEAETRADRTAPGTPPIAPAIPTPSPTALPELTVDQQLDAWLRTARERTRITFMKEAFR